MSQQPIKIPELTTERLVLKALSEDDSTGMFALWSDPRVVMYSGEVRDYAGQVLPMPADSPETSDAIISFWQQAQCAGWGFRWAIHHEGQFIGIAGFNQLGETAELAWHLLPARWQQGYMIEACKRIIDWYTDQRTSGCIDAYIEPENAASIALAERLGFVATQEFGDSAHRYRLQYGV
jgi:RimJ/RimL family protein N-acetyltransferase